jgi:hypothetical protein
LRRGVDAPLAAPDADDEEHRHQHRFPEEVEQEEVLRDERADHGELDGEHHGVEELHFLGDRGEKALATTSGPRNAVSSTSSTL